MLVVLIDNSIKYQRNGKIFVLLDEIEDCIFIEVLDSAGGIK